MINTKKVNEAKLQFERARFYNNTRKEYFALTSAFIEMFENRGMTHDEAKIEASTQIIKICEKPVSYKKTFKTTSN